jgi:NADPH-dependent 2,4-dienoyl-CoA reductase/sulfur reductase-like enzyme/nitrite reductase/ring-hydroxylating ferredoxin subunit
MSVQTDKRVDLTAGVAIGDLADGAMLAGRVGEDDALLLRRGNSLFAFAAHCTHYGGALADGLVVEDTVRCPLHHACFDLHTGEALRAPAFDPIVCWRVEQRDGKAFVREQVVATPRSRQLSVNAAHPESIVIVGGGAAGFAAAEMLRRAGYRNRLTMVSADDSPPCDRPNLSKDYLAGTASDDWIPLRPPTFYREHEIELVLGARVISLDVARRCVVLEDGRTLSYGALLLATGADPVRLEIPGAAAQQVHYLRSYADSQAIAARAAKAKRAVIVGTSFIGLEVAAALRTRDIEVHVIGREAIPMERVLGADVGRRVRVLHESHGVVFHLQTTLETIDGSNVRLADGTVIHACDLVVVGVGVRPELAIAERAGLALDRGLIVDEFLQTSASGIYAAGDIARWPDRRTGERIRVEHWVVAEAQGQAAALNMLGLKRRFEAIPFFWSQHYDFAIRYVGHAERWNRVEIDGSIERFDAIVRYRVGDRTLAVATLGRDIESLRCEASMEHAFDEHPLGPLSY